MVRKDKGYGITNKFYLTACFYFLGGVDGFDVKVFWEFESYRHAFRQKYRKMLYH